METYTLKKIAEKVGIPESTIRYYRDRHKGFVPYIGKGRRRRYTQESLDILLRICAYADENLNAFDIEERLNAEYDRIVEVSAEENETQTQRRSSATQQEKALVKADEILPTVQGVINQALTETLTVMADQKIRIEALEAKMETLTRPTRPKPSKAKAMTNIRLLCLDAMTELEQIRANLDQIAEQVKKRAIP